jgi:cation diffusion facilitator CzcD-associated flavoprotein CzcO
MHSTTQLLIVGAGPFGLSLAAAAKAAGIDVRIVGHPMSFWTDHMPAGMCLRSGADWHLDPSGVHTMSAFFAASGLPAAGPAPLPLPRYLEYVEWFRRAIDVNPLPVHVARLDRGEPGRARFLATLENGDTIAADNVALAIGFEYFAHIPPELADRIPADLLSHTCDLVDFTALRDRACLIVGGRQSAFEWAALLLEAGARAVHVSYRHDTPRFVESDWSWVMPLMNRTLADPGWFRRLTAAERDDLVRRFWEEGRLKLEPWLAPRLTSATLWPRTEVTSCAASDGTMAVTLSNGTTVAVDQVIAATGYRVDLSRVPMLASGDTLAGIACANGFPELDEFMQSSVPGLFISSLPATRDFGPFFGFTVASRVSAQLIVSGIGRGGVTG